MATAGCTEPSGTEIRPSSGRILRSLNRRGGCEVNLSCCMKLTAATNAVSEELSEPDMKIVPVHAPLRVTVHVRKVSAIGQESSSAH